MAAKIALALAQFDSIVQHLGMVKDTKKGKYKAYAPGSAAAPLRPCVEVFFNKDATKTSDISLVNFTLDNVEGIVPHKFADKIEAGKWYKGVQQQIDLTRGEELARKAFFAACKHVIKLSAGAKPAAEPEVKPFDKDAAIKQFEAELEKA